MKDRIYAKEEYKMNQLKGWLIVNGCLKNKHFNEMAQMYLEAALANQIALELVYNHELLIGIESGKLFLKGEQVSKPDFALFLDKDIHLARQLENLNIRLFNRAEVIETCDNKALTFQKLADCHIPMPKTIIAPLVYKGMKPDNHTFIESVAKELGYPLVVKESFGSFGEQVYLIEDWEALLAIYEKLVDVPHIYQEFIASSKGRDVRLNVVGGKVVAAMERVSTSDFRANIARGSEAHAFNAPESFINLANRICHLLRIDFAGVDLLFGEHQEPILCEVNSNAHIKGTLSCTGVNVAEHIMAYIKIKCDNHNEV